jgi:hypothetical protein
MIGEICGLASGSLRIDGQTVELRSVRDARNAGIETVFQDLALVNQLTTPTKPMAATARQIAGSNGIPHPAISLATNGASPNAAQDRTNFANMRTSAHTWTALRRDRCSWWSGPLLSTLADRVLLRLESQVAQRHVRIP